MIDRSTALGASSINFDPQVLRLGSGMSEIEVPWPTLVRLTAIDPPPNFEIEWIDSTGRQARVVHLYNPMNPRGLQFEVEKLFDFAEAKYPERIERGWLDIARLEWEQVRGLPTISQPPTAGYRTAAVLDRDPVLAERSAPTPYEALLGWIGVSMYARRERRMVLTAEYLYAEQRDETAWRLPLSRLRDKRGTGEEAMYVFGRNTRVFLAFRASCPLAAGLDAALAGENVEAAAQREQTHGSKPMEASAKEEDLSRIEPVQWESTRTFPKARDGGGAGAYRSGNVEERVVVRAPPDPLTTMLQWLASSPDNPFPHQPRRVAVTPSHVVIQRRDGRRFRLPLSTLRTRRTNGNDAVYVFGRDTELLVPYVEDCPVKDALDAALPLPSRLPAGGS